MSEGVRLDRTGAVALITLDRPDRGNAIDLPVAEALLSAAIACDEDEAIRCVVLTGAGRLFCAGGDVGAFAAAGDEVGALVKAITAPLHNAIATFARMNKPLVTAINGPAAGAGVGLAILGDIALAAPEASFALAYSRLGLSPDAGATWLLPRLVGLRRAQELCLAGTKVDAQDAAKMGLVSRVVASGELVAATNALAVELAQGPTSALGVTRNLLLASPSSSFETQLEQERRGIASQSVHPEGREGVAAFNEKRSPRF